MKLQNIDLPMPEIERFCQKWNLTEFALFGSVLCADFRSDSSDIDVMVKFHPEVHVAFQGFGYLKALEQMEEELEALLGKKIDLITRSSIEQSANYIRRHEILSSARVIYESGSSISA
jgi:uncharacterized protein